MREKWMGEKMGEKENKKEKKERRLVKAVKGLAKWGAKAGLVAGLLVGSCEIEQNIGGFQGYLGKMVEESQTDCSGLKKYICPLGFPRLEERLKELYKQGVRGNVIIFDREGNIAGEFKGLSKRIGYQEISEKVVKAWKAAEDKRFDYHQGSDLGALAWAAAENLKGWRREKQIWRGASTTEHTLADYILNGNNKVGKKGQEKIEGKIKEIIYSTFINRKFSKEERLAHVLNLVYFGYSETEGKDIIGLEAAADYYFNKKAKELTWSESVVLVAMIKKPSVGQEAYKEMIGGKEGREEREGKEGREGREWIEGTEGREEKERKNWQWLKGRSLYISEELKALGWIDEKNYYKTKRELMRGELGFYKRALDSPGYLAAVRQKIEKWWKQEKALGDLNVYTYLDPKLQDFVEGVVGKQLTKIKAEARFPHPELLNGEAIVADIETGEVLALVGKATKTYFSPGSAFKPFVWATGLEKGLMMTDTFLDAPAEFEVWEGFYQPKNFQNKWSYKPVSLLSGLAHSNNIIAVKLYQYLKENYGEEVVKEQMEKLGLEMEVTGLSAALGSNEMSLWELTGGYRVLTTGFIDRYGERNFNLSLIEGIKYEELTRLVDGSKERVISELTQKEINKGLREVVRAGTARSAEIEDHSLGCKTGTGKTSFGIICQEPDLGYLVSVYFASDKPAMTGEFGEEYSGSKYAAPLAKEIFKYLIKERY